MDATDLGQGLVAGSCEHGNELYGSIKAENFLTRAEFSIKFSRTILDHRIS
jgi:hypothetical protein